MRVHDYRDALGKLQWAITARSPVELSADEAWVLHEHVTELTLQLADSKIQHGLDLIRGDARYVPHSAEGK